MTLPPFLELPTVNDSDLMLFWITFIAVIWGFYGWYIYKLFKRDKR